MLQKDYYLRLIREFAEALQIFISRKKHGDDFYKELNELYSSYLGPSDFYHVSDMGTIMHDFECFPEDERAGRMEMLAMLYYVEAGEKIGPFKNILYERALLLFDFLDAHSRTYSIDRENKISYIRSQLGLNNK